MAKFCIHCGKPLEEGEVCTCQEAVAENAATENTTAQTESAEIQTPVENVQAETPVTPTPQTTTNTEGTTNNTTNKASSNEFVEKLKLVFTKFVDYFKSPTNTAKEFAAMNDSMYGILMICSNLIVLFLLALILVSAGANAVRSIPILGSMLSGSAFPVSLMITVIFAAYYFAMAGMLTFTTKVLFKGSMTFKQAVSIVGVNAFINAVILLAAIILMLISPALGMIVLYLGFIYSSLMEYVTYIEMADISSDKKAYALLISIIGVILAVFVASTVMGAIVGSSMTNSFGSYGSGSYDIDYSDFLD